MIFEQVPTCFIIAQYCAICNNINTCGIPIDIISVFSKFEETTSYWKLKNIQKPKENLENNQDETRSVNFVALYYNMNLFQFWCDSLAISHLVVYKFKHISCLMLMLDMKLEFISEKLEHFKILYIFNRII